MGLLIDPLSKLLTTWYHHPVMRVPVGHVTLVPPPHGRSSHPRNSFSRHGGEQLAGHDIGVLDAASTRSTL